MLNQRVSILCASGWTHGAPGPLYAAIDGRFAAIIAVSDPIKPTTPQAIRALHGLGLKVAMITGDNRRTAEAIAAELGIDEVVAEVLPDGKVEAVKRLREGGRAVAFVFAYNASLIPVAAGVLYPFGGTLLSPMLAAGAMALSSVFVLGNALRLKRFAAPVRTKGQSELSLKPVPVGE